MLIIPAIDIIENSVVRLSKGKYEDVTNYAISPLEQAIRYEEAGFEWLHIIDLIGSKEGTMNIADTIGMIKSHTKLKIEFGGGIRTSQDVLNAMNNGVDKVIIGSMSVTNSTELEKAVAEAGADKIIIAADVLNETIRIKGWTENSGVLLNDHITRCFDLGITDYLVTDINKDGLLQGPSLELYQKTQEYNSKINLIASGGVSSIKDIQELSDINCFAVVVGRAIYEKKISLEELKNFGN